MRLSLAARRTPMLVALGGAMSALGSAAGAQLPGTPVGGGAFGLINLVDGARRLPGLVTPGDVVLQEVLPLPQPVDRTKWSDVVRFFNAPDATGAMRGWAILLSDGENGFGNIGVRYVVRSFANAVSSFDLPDALDPNNQFVLEGIGNLPNPAIADPTPWVVPGVRYNVFSDVNEVEPPPGPKLPGAVVPVPGQPSNLILVFGERSPECDFPNGPCGGVSTNMALVPGVATVCDVGNFGAGPCGPGSDVSDLLNVAANGDITLTFSEDGPGPDEELPLIVLDEGTSGNYFVDDLPEPEVPEPATLALVAPGLFVIGGLRSRARRRR